MDAETKARHAMDARMVRNDDSRKADLAREAEIIIAGRKAGMTKRQLAAARKRAKALIDELAESS